MGSIIFVLRDNLLLLTWYTCRIKESSVIYSLINFLSSVVCEINIFIKSSLIFTTRKTRITYRLLHTDQNPYVKSTLHTDFYIRIKFRM